MNVVNRLASMGREELRFRVTCELRNAAERAQWSLATPRWERSDLSRILTPASKFDSSHLSQARSAAAAADWHTAHRALASHFARQPSAFPLEARAIGRVTDRIRARFPEAPAAGAARAERVLEGHYDLLGYTSLSFGRPPRWDFDPVHDRVAPGGFWSAVPYLDPEGGDHKIIWELNRHQHWLSLGRAYHLTSDARYYDEFVVQLENWLEANPPLTGVNWASMLELGFRSLSWLWALHLFAGAAAAGAEQAPGSSPAAFAPWTVDLLVGLDRQLTHIEHNLSRYFSPNTHLTGEALALYVSGIALPELAASGRRLAAGREVLLREIDHQIRADGGHAELSAHYHRYSTDFYLLAVLAARGSRDGETGRFEEAALRQARYLRTLADDQGRLPLTGDDDGGQLFPICGRPPIDCRDTLANAAAILGVPELVIGDVPEETFWLCGSTLALEPATAAPETWPSTALPSTGYYVSRNALGDHLIFDAGPHGFLNGGHAHSDALAVILTVAGVPLLVDPGTATYTMDPGRRDRFRSTAMHNTVVLNGRPQSQPQGPFSWASAAEAHASLWRAGKDADYVEGRHAAYAPLIHARGVLAVHGFGWFLIDHFLGPGSATAEAFWHLHPDWTVEAADENGASFRHRSGLEGSLAASAPLRLTQSEFAGVYGRVEPAACLECPTSGPLPRSVLTFVPSTQLSARAIRIEPLEAASDPGWHRAAFRIRLDSMEAVVLAAIERNGVPPASTSAPGRLWGSSDVNTDARVALLVTREGRADEAVLVNGQQFTAPGVHVNLPAPLPLTRIRLDRFLAQP